MARESSGTRRAGFRDTVDKTWNIASKPPPKRRRPRPTKKARAAATDSALVDLVDWIAQHPTVTDQIVAIANTLDKEVVAELDRSFDDAHRDDRRRPWRIISGATCSRRSPKCWKSFRSNWTRFPTT